MTWDPWRSSLNAVYTSPTRWPVLRSDGWSATVYSKTVVASSPTFGRMWSNQPKWSVLHKGAIENFLFLWRVGTECGLCPFYGRPNLSPLFVSESMPWQLSMLHGHQQEGGLKWWDYNPHSGSFHMVTSWFFGVCFWSNQNNRLKVLF